MTTRAATDHPVHDLIASRWSPYSFADRPVSRDDLLSLFEAARWAASSYNEQPWTYIVATRDDRPEFERLLSCLVEGNQAWAKAAPVLAIGCTSLLFARNGQPNAAAVHDLGLASGNLALEATARGLVVHQMIGILPDRAREVYKVPEGVQPLTGLAIGYAGDPAALPEPMRARDAARRPRKPLSAFVFAGQWGTTSPAVRWRAAMNRWYWGAVVCAALFALTWLVPPYMTEEWGVVWRSEVGRGWNNLDADGNPRHDDLGNRIRPNPVRTAGLVVFGVGALTLAAAGYFDPKKRRKPPDPQPPRA